VTARRWAAVALIPLLAACTPQTSAPTATPETTRATAALPDLPAMRRFSGNTSTAPQRPNSEIAADFIDLAFQMESGRRLLFLSRFNTPITLRVTGPVPASVGPDLSALLSRFRREAGIDISRVSAITNNHIAAAKLCLRRIKGIPAATDIGFKPGM